MSDLLKLSASENAFIPLIRALKWGWLAINGVWTVHGPGPWRLCSGLWLSLAAPRACDTLQGFCLKLCSHFFLEQSASSFLSGRQAGDATVTQKNDLISPRSFWKAMAEPSGACSLPQSLPPQAAWKWFSSG